MEFRPANPLIVQSDHTLLLETLGPHFAAARDALAPFAELVKSPEYMHTYRLTALSLWNAASAGMSVDRVVEALSSGPNILCRPMFPLGFAIRWVGLVVWSFSVRRMMARLFWSPMTPLMEVRGSRGIPDLLGDALDKVSTGLMRVIEAC